MMRQGARSAIITGAARSVGKVLAKGYIAEGATIAIAGFDIVARTCNVDGGNRMS